MDAPGALQPLGSWTQLTSLFIDGRNMSCTRGSLEQQLTQLSALQHLGVDDMHDFELPPGRWQGQLTSLVCDLHHVLPDGSPTSAAAMLAHANALRRLKAWGRRHSDKPPQPQLRALLGALAALPALEHVEVARSELQREVEEAHTALGSPLGARLQFSQW